MKILKRSLQTKIKLRADLARLSSKDQQLFINYSDVSAYLKNKVKLDYSTSKSIHHADKTMQYIEMFADGKIRIKRTDHIIALLCNLSDDPFGSKLLSEEFYDYSSELQDRLDGCSEFNYNGVLSSVVIMDFLSFSDFLSGTPCDGLFALYNLFLHQEDMCLVLEDTDRADRAMIRNMKHKVERYAESLNL